MSFFTKIKMLFGGVRPQTVDNIMDKDGGLLVRAGGFINDLHYSDAEKAKDTAAMATAMTDFVKSTLGESTQRSQTRRNIAIRWINFQLVLVGLCVFAATGEFFLSEGEFELAAFYWQVATSNLMMYGTISVLAFFFGAHLLRTANPFKKG